MKRALHILSLVVGLLGLMVLFALKPWQVPGEQIGAIGVGLLAAIVTVPLFVLCIWGYMGLTEKNP